MILFYIEISEQSTGNDAALYRQSPIPDADDLHWIGEIEREIKNYLRDVIENVEPNTTKENVDKIVDLFKQIDKGR